MDEAFSQNNLFIIFSAGQGSCGRLRLHERRQRPLQSGTRVRVPQGSRPTSRQGRDGGLIV